MARVPGGKSTSISRSPEKRVRGALSRSRVTRQGWFIGEVRAETRSRGEVEARPGVGFGEEREAFVRVHGRRMADDAEHRHVGVAVAEGEAVVEVVAVRARVLADEASLRRTRDDWPSELAGRDAVLHLEPVRDDLA